MEFIMKTKISCVNEKISLILVPIKEVFTKETKPFPQIRSFLITREILQYLGLNQTLDFLRKGNHRTRAYLLNHGRMLIAVVKSDTVFTLLNLDQNKIMTSVISYCGRPDTVL